MNMLSPTRTMNRIARSCLLFTLLTALSCLHVWGQDALVLTLTGQPGGEVNCVAFSPDGSIVASGALDQDVEEFHDQHAIINITFDPPLPATLGFNDRVSFTFDYTTTEPGGVYIWGTPFTGGRQSGGLAQHGSVLHPTGEGSLSGWFTIREGAQTVDQVRFQMTDADRNVLYEAFVDVQYTFGVTIDESGTITVQPGDSIQEAIDAAPEGAVIYLAEGHWEEHIAIEKNLGLRGSGSSMTAISGHAEDTPVIAVRAGEGGSVEVLVDGLRVMGGTGENGHGIVVTGAVQVVIQRTTIDENGGSGVVLRDTAEAAIRDCIISQNRFGIYAWDSAQTTVLLTTVSDNTSDGVVLGHTSQGMVNDSDVSDNGRFGVWLWNYSQVAITRCTIARNGARGLWVGWVDGDAPHAELRCSTLIGNGIMIRASASAVVADCFIEGALDGITLLGLAQATIENNVIQNNERHGVVLGERPCVETDLLFAGHVMGGGNVAGDNANSNFCPEDLAFLFTEEGGELDRRE